MHHTASLPLFSRFPGTTRAPRVVADAPVRHRFRTATSLFLSTLFLALPPAAPAMETLRQYIPAAEATPTPVPAAEATATPDSTPAPTPDPDVAKQPPVIRVNVASQSSNFSQPWRKNPPVLRQGLGVVLMDGRILVTAELVANHSYVELEKPETALKAAAQVEVVDYDANLALLAAPAADSGSRKAAMPIAADMADSPP